MIPDKSDKYGDFNIDLNTIIARLKNLALQFDNGRGLRVISPFQTNRQGRAAAEKNDGNYELSALSNANEAERSSDLVISVYMTKQMRQAGLVKIGCLKHRRGAFFNTFEAKIDFQSKHVRDIIQKGPEDEELSIIPIDISK
jgi:ornithine cyclodeaminase/alanine dehydrogenase-like protein (mu-crystallin family)